MQPSESIVFLHITDLHFKVEGSDLENYDVKDGLENTDFQKKEDAFKDTLKALLLEHANKQISAILLTGDYDNRGPSGGMLRLKNILKDAFGKNVPPIVVVPGNHDVLRGSEPSSKERYKTFTDCWRVSDINHVTPFLDGVDEAKKIDKCWKKHCLVSKEKNNQFIIIPINSCNWSQSKLEYGKKHEEFAEVLTNEFNSTINVAVAQENFKTVLNQAMQNLLMVDAARVSNFQFDALKKIIKKAESEAGEGAIKIALIHHHILPINTREELKIYSDITNLGALRQFLYKQGINILLHGHKHSDAVYVDHIYEEGNLNFDTHEVLVVSGGTIKNDTKDTFRIIELENLPYAPLCRISKVLLETSEDKFDKQSHIKKVASRRLWKLKNPKEPIIVSGKNINEVYERACQLFSDDKKTLDKLDKTVVCYVEFDGESEAEAEISPPARYPRHPSEDKDEIQRTGELTEWFKETVKWWQLDHSKSEKRIPYIHGTRLYRFGGAKNQITRIVKLLEDSNSTSKAIAVLIDPIRDFHDEPEKKNPERFASFCFVQFKIHNKHLECIAYYRAQEFCKWWPVNVAELRKLQVEIGKQLGIMRGGITTITGDARIEEKMSPTQVAVPLIDQWLDSYPEKIGALAHAILCPKSAKLENLAEWHRCFDDINESTKAHSKEGIPIAIEGLKLLKLFLEEFSDNSKPHIELIKEVDCLLKANDQFLGKEKDQKAFVTWSGQVQTHVNGIKNKANELAAS